ncbi:DUF4221 family protein [Cecembia calidifontis]|uniref:Uncharacterized protein DUF4221 n=1 Tax=Cecembia calidifontis TaxID=1187080 RepID=A0A4Q7PFV8_9BACT|nr:DUF4221 family protein [Cecembia calidifontis]RZS98580.1 uncharacterized protein DUF4221 [Cecembia calidifontis]
MKKNYFINIHIALFLISCDIKNENSLEYDYLKFLNDSVGINLDDSTSNEFMRTQYLKSGEKEFLYHYNQFKDKIEKFDLETGLLAKTIGYPNDEPYVIKLVQGISVVNEDSIFLYPSLGIRGTILINDNGELIQRYLPDKTKDLETSLVNHISFGAQRTLIFGDKIYFIHYPLFEMSNPSNINSDFKFEVIYDTKLNKVEYLDESSFPNFYHNKIWPSNHLQVSREVNCGKWIYSWNMEDSILVIDRENENSTYINAKSKFKNKEFEPFRMMPNNDQKIQFTLTNLKYYGIYYDQFRKLYYRTVQLPGSYQKRADAKLLDANRDFSIIILDDSFNIIDEVLFKGGIYNIYRLFVGEKGVYLPLNNPNYNGQKEDILHYHIFNFSR